MTNLDPVADRVVRDAVDAYLDGHLAPQLASERAGETVFETKNSRYRLLDGVVVQAPDDSLIGSELVGWLIESARRSVVESTWQPGSRAVLVDRHRGRNIIVTSSTRLLHVEGRLDGRRRQMSTTPEAYRRGSSASSWPPPPDVYVEAPPQPPLPSYGMPVTMGETPMPPAQPAFSPRNAPIRLATPTPPPVAPATMAGPPPPAGRPPQGYPAAQYPPALAVTSSTTQRRAGAIHLPPRPIAPGAPPPGRPTPWPGPSTNAGVPYHPQPSAPTIPAHGGVHEPPADGAWELTSGEFELEEARPAETDDASRSPPSQEEPGSGVADAPIPLVKPVGYGAVEPPRVPRPRR